MMMNDAERRCFVVAKRDKKNPKQLSAVVAGITDDYADARHLCRKMNKGKPEDTFLVYEILNDSKKFFMDKYVKGVVTK